MYFVYEWIKKKKKKNLATLFVSWMLSWGTYLKSSLGLLRKILYLSQETLLALKIFPQIPALRSNTVAHEGDMVAHGDTMLLMEIPLLLMEIPLLLMEIPLLLVDLTRTIAQARWRLMVSFSRSWWSWLKPIDSRYLLTDPYLTKQKTHLCHTQS